MVSVPVNPNALSNHYNPRRTRVFVGGLNKSINVADVMSYFAKFGEVVDVRKPKNSVACIDFKTKFIATTAMAAGKVATIKGTKVELSRKLPGVPGVGAPAPVQNAPVTKKFVTNPEELERIPTGGGGTRLGVPRPMVAGRVGVGQGRGGAPPGVGAVFTKGFRGNLRAPFQSNNFGGDFMNGISDNFPRNLNMFDGPGPGNFTDVVPSVQSTIQSLMRENLKLRTTAPSQKQELDRLLIQNMRRLQQENESYTRKLTSYERDNDSLRETLSMANASLIKTQQQNALEVMNKDLVTRLSLAEMLKQTASIMPLQQQELQQPQQQQRNQAMVTRPGTYPIQQQKNVLASIRNRLDVPVHKRLGGVQKRLGVTPGKARVQVAQRGIQNRNFRGIQNRNFRGKGDFSKFNTADSWQ